MLLLFSFKSASFPKVTNILGPALLPIKIMGRHTLLIYVAHLVFLNMLMLVLGDDRYGLGQVQILAPSFHQMILAVTG